MLIPPKSGARMRGACLDVYPGQTMTLTLDMMNAGQMAAKGVHAELVLPTGRSRLTRASGFVWYDYTPSPSYLPWWSRPPHLTALGATWQVRLHATRAL